jgi:hypothetical protein
MSSDSAEVRAMLSALAPRVESCREALSAQAVGNVLYGLQGMSSDSAEVRAMLSALAPKVVSCREALDVQAVGNALYGLQGMGEEDSYMTLQIYLLEKATSIAGNTSLCEALTCEDLVFFGQHLALTVPKLQVVLNNDCERWENLNSIITEELLVRKNTSDVFFSLRDSRTDAEERVYDILKMVFNNSNISISSNEYLFNLFESDIVLRIPIVNDSSSSKSRERDLIINIEVDGIHHKQERKKRFCMLRDKYLEAQDVVIERIDASVLSRMEDKKIKDWIQERVAEAQKLQL